MKNPVTYDNPASDRLVAVEECMYHVKEMLDELRGLGEYEEWWNTLDDLYSEMEQEQDSLESYASGEQQAMIDELSREYYRDQLWEDV